MTIAPRDTTCGRQRAVRAAPQPCVGAREVAARKGARIVLEGRAAA